MNRMTFTTTILLQPCITDWLNLPSLHKNTYTQPHPTHAHTQHEQQQPTSFSPSLHDPPLGPAMVNRDKYYSTSYISYECDHKVNIKACSQSTCNVHSIRIRAFTLWCALASMRIPIHISESTSRRGFDAHSSSFACKRGNYHMIAKCKSWPQQLCESVASKMHVLKAMLAPIEAQNRPKRK